MIRQTSIALASTSQVQTMLPVASAQSFQVSVDQPSPVRKLSRGQRMVPVSGMLTGPSPYRSWSSLSVRICEPLRPVSVFPPRISSIVEVAVIWCLPVRSPACLSAETSGRLNGIAVFPGLAAPAPLD